nr:hypothetical protein [Tanacetum cinerariifolium]
CGDSLDSIFCHQCNCESCGNGAHYGYNCPPKVLIISNPEPGHNQNVDEFPQTLPSFPPTCYFRDENLFAYDSTPNFVNDSPNVFNPPPQTPTDSYEFCGNDAHYSHDCPPQDALGNKQYKLEDIQELIRKLFNDVQNIHEELAEYINTLSWNRPAFYNYDDDDDEDYTIAITPVLSTEEPDNSLSMGDEHLDTILATESDKVIKSSVEDLVLIPSESEGILDNILLPYFISPLRIVTLSLRSLILLSYLDNSLLEFETFSDHTEETSCGSTTTHADYSLPEYDSFIFEIEPDQSELTSVVMEDILGEPRVHVPNVLPTHPTLYLDSNFTPSDNSLPESEIFYFDIKEKNSGSTTIHADISLLNLECFY